MVCHFQNKKLQIISHSTSLDSQNYCPTSGLNNVFNITIFNAQICI